MPDMRKLFYLFLFLWPFAIYAQQNWVKSFPLDYTWSIGNARFSAGEAYFISLAFNSSGQPYVAYQDVLKSWKSTVMGF